MDVYDALVEKAMEYLSDNHFTKSALSSHRVCYREFRNHLDNYGLTYSIEVGNRWLEDNKPTWPPWLYRSRRKCLQRIEELQTYGKVINVQYYGHVYDYDLLNASFQEHLDAFLDSISKSRADQTVKCCRCACASFLMFMQNRDRDCLDDIEYSDLIAFHDLDTHKSKEHNECYIREFLEFAASKAWCSKGFSVLLSPQIIHRAMFLETFTIVDPQEFESLRIQSLDFPPDEFLASIEQFVSASEEKRYCSAFLRMARRCLLSLYLFLDINGFGYTPEISDLWLLEMKPQLDSQFVEWRRILEQYKKYSEEGDFNPGVVFSYQPDPIEALPGWITEELLRFLSMKKKEGLSESSLKSYKTTVIHFSEFLMETGITEFSSITADILLQFNQTDQHATAKGKSTVNSLVSVFIEYLEDADILENKHLHKVLPRRSAKNVKLIETLSEEEVELLDNINPSDMSPLGLRDCAMVLVARRLGFRSSDIVDIEYHDIDWKNDTISTLQRKTKKGLILPLPNDVRNAIVRYMKYGRPYSRCPKIFIKHMVPYNGMTVSACGDALSRLLHGKKGQPVKFHRTRKSYGTGLVRGGAAHDIASNMLGHNSCESLSSYFSADETRMRELPLSLNELGILPKGGLL